MHLKTTHLSLISVLLLACFMSTQAWAGNLPDFTQLAKSNSPSVVNISSHQSVKTHNYRGLPKGFEIPNLPKDSPFNDLFKHFFDERQGNRGFGHRETKSLGSGFIISEDGYILTNHHVISDADEIEVSLSDRRSFSAKIIGSDKGSDIALIKIDAEKLPVVKIGKSHQLEVGEWVLAIGSPFGFDHSVTAGIVSAKGRNLPSENYVPFIQTDVAINPGNSGGPLLNLEGEVVGVNSQIYSRTGGFMGLSFSIPIELAMNVVDQLKENGSVVRGYLGVLIQDVDRNLAESFGLDKPKGALVSRVLPDSPAEDAGLKPGDIILSFNGQALRSSSELPPLVGSSRIKGDANIGVLRDGGIRNMKIRVGQLPTESTRAMPAKAEDPVVNELGLEVTDLSIAARKRAKLAKGGALIAQVNEGPGQIAGLRRGDVIQMFDGKSVKNASHLKELIDAAEGKRSVAILIQREQGPLFLALRLKN